MFIIIQYREFVRAQKKFELHATKYKNVMYIVLLHVCYCVIVRDCF